MTGKETAHALLRISTVVRVRNVRTRVLQVPRHRTSKQMIHLRSSHVRSRTGSARTSTGSIA
jgi:hypothetical protein